jgi:hypothetical protein
MEKYIFEQMASDESKNRKEDFINIAKKMYEGLTDKQKEFVSDKHRLRAVLASRRTGKSYAIAVELYIACLKKNNSNCVYATLTRKSGKGILWNLLKRFSQEHGIGVKFNNTELIATFPNGSQIAIVGAENAAEIEKLRGQSYDLVFIDECKSFPLHIMKELIDEVIKPALLDTRGRLALAGTPGAILSGVFYDVTCGKLGITHKLYGSEFKGRFEYSVHKWKMEDNTAVPHLMEEALLWKEQAGIASNDPRWIREYEGEWIASDDALIYKYNVDNDGFNNWVPEEDADNRYGLPSGHQWKFLLGIDLGFEDATAFEVAAYSPTCRILYQLFDYKSGHMIVPDIAAKVKELEDIFGEFEAIVGDFGGLGKMVGQTLSLQYGINIIPAEKKEKFDHIELLNSDLLSGNVMIRRDSFLHDEIQVLQWDSTGLKEHSGCANHCCDAFLYLWRYSYHHLMEKKVEGPEYNTDAYWKSWENQEWEAACARSRKKTSNEYGYDMELDNYGFYDIMVDDD